MAESENKILKDWIKFLDGDEVRFQLTCTSLYLTAYELLIDSIVSKTKDFFIDGLKDGELSFSDDYRKVKALFPKDIVIASSLWLRNMEVIDDNDVERIKEFKKYRNELAHEMPKIISDTSHDVKTSYINEIKYLYRKIHLWWFIEFEATINSDLDEVDLEKLDYDEVLLFVMLPMNHMSNIVNDEIQRREIRKSKK
jgi:hypothetical protein